MNDNTEWDTCTKCDTPAPLDGRGHCIDCIEDSYTHRDMVIDGGNLPASPLPNSVPLSSVFRPIWETAVELRGFIDTLLEELDSNPYPTTLGDNAGDIRGNAAHLWNLLIAVKVEQTQPDCTCPNCELGERADCFRGYCSDCLAYLDSPNAVWGDHCDRCVTRNSLRTLNKAAAALSPSERASARVILDRITFELGLA